VNWILVVPDGEHCAEPLHFIIRWGIYWLLNGYLISLEGFCFMELVYWNLSTLKGLVFVLWGYTTAHFALAGCRDTKIM